MSEKLPTPSAKNGAEREATISSHRLTKGVDRQREACLMLMEFSENPIAAYREGVASGIIPAFMDPPLKKNDGQKLDVGV